MKSIHSAKVICSFGDGDGGRWAAFLEHRIGDKRVIRLIIKWLNAGVMESGKWQDELRVVPQGVI